MAFRYFNAFWPKVDMWPEANNTPPNSYSQQTKDPNVLAKCLELALSKCDLMAIENGKVYKMADDFYDYIVKPLTNDSTFTDGTD